MHWARLDFDSFTNKKGLCYNVEKSSAFRSVGARVHEEKESSGTSRKIKNALARLDRFLETMRLSLSDEGG